MKISRLLLIILLVAAGVGLLMTIMSYGKHPDWPLLRTLMFALSGVMAALSIGASILFLRNLKQFKAGPRLAYKFICAGIVLFGISQVQIPLVQYFDFIFLLASGLVGLPYLLSVVFIMIGMRVLAKSLAVQSRWSSLWWVGFVAVLASAASTLLPYHLLYPEDLMMVQVTGALAVWDAVFF